VPSTLNAAPIEGTAGQAILTIPGSDPEGQPLTYTIVSGNDDGLFALSPTGQLQTTGPLDFETAAQHVLVIVTSDGTNQVTTTITLNVVDENEPPVIPQLPDQQAAVGAPFDLVVSATDPDTLDDVTLSTSSPLPPGIGVAVDAGAQEIRIFGTTDDLSFKDTTISVTIEAIDTGLPALQAAPMTFDIVFGDIAISPFHGQFVINEVLYAESEKWDAADPDAALVMDEYIELRNIGPLIDIEGWFLSDTKYPQQTDDLDFHLPGPIGPGDAGRLFQDYSQSTVLDTDQVVTAVVRRPNWGTIQLHDGSTMSAKPFQFRGTDYGFPPPSSSNWEALNDAGDDIWFWDDQARLVAYVAWDDGSGDAHIDGRPEPWWGVWDPSVEARLAGADPGQSISLAAPGEDATCWELTGSGDATCADADPTVNKDAVITTPSGRVSSQGLTND